MPLLFTLYIAAKEKPGTTCWGLPGFIWMASLVGMGFPLYISICRLQKWADVCACAHLSCEKLSRKSVAALE